MVLSEKWAVDQETKLVMTGDMSGDNWSMVDMVKLRLGEVVLWLAKNLHIILLSSTLN